MRFLEVCSREFFSKTYACAKLRMAASANQRKVISDITINVRVTSNPLSTSQSLVFRSCSVKKFYKRSAIFLKVLTFPEINSTEIDMSTFGVDMHHGFPVYKMGNNETKGNIEPSSTEKSSNDNQPTLSELESDDLTCLFKLAVMLTRGNPFNSRKHWGMKTVFLETKFKIELMEKPREADEHIDSVAVKVDTAISRSEPKVRFIHVAPCRPDEPEEDDGDSFEGREVLNNKFNDGYTARCKTAIDRYISMNLQEQKGK